MLLRKLGESGLTKTNDALQSHSSLNFIHSTYLEANESFVFFFAFPKITLQSFRMSL